MHIGKSIPRDIPQLPKKTWARTHCLVTMVPPCGSGKGALARTGRHIPSPAGCQPFSSQKFARCEEFDVQGVFFDRRKMICLFEESRGR
jgi:hypothetical protein